MALILKYKGVIISLLLVVFGGWLFYPTKKPDDVSDAVKGVKDIMSLGYNMTRASELNKYAFSLAHHLGTAYGWGNWSSWTENDDEAYNLVKPLSFNEVKAVSAVYGKYYTNKKNRSLKVDLRKYLDSGLYDSLTNL